MKCLLMVGIYSDSRIRYFQTIGKHFTTTGMRVAMRSGIFMLVGVFSHLKLTDAASDKKDHGYAPEPPRGSDACRETGDD